VDRPTALINEISVELNAIAESWSAAVAAFDETSVRLNHLQACVSELRRVSGVTDDPAAARVVHLRLVERAEGE
jgi:hypothetical protein